MLRAPALAASILASALVAASPQDATLLLPVHVDRVLVDARILDSRGRALRGLRPEDLRVRIDGKPARVESLDWIAETAVRGESRPSPSSELPTAGRYPTAEDPGRQIVFLFQKDFFEPGRLKGLIHMKEYAADFARRLSPRDRAAVLVFDSHLRLHLDFTSDPERLAEALRFALLRREPREILAGEEPSLGRHLDRSAARNAATAEKGLEVLGQALEKVPGPKSLVFFCWGLGSLQGGNFQMDPDYGPARRALERSRTAVFALDVSYADFHSLEVGLQQVAADTGGFYARTHHSPVVAMDRLAGALAGHYVLALERPAGSRGSHEIAVDLRARKGTVLARSTYVD
ncbi:MAG TPA: VWA domain-containing protein [Vicinamibacteria bacterium]